MKSEIKRITGILGSLGIVIALAVFGIAQAFESGPFAEDGDVETNTAVGENASALCVLGSCTSVGYLTSTLNSDGTAVGAFAQAVGIGGTALGGTAQAPADLSTAIGSFSTADGIKGTAVGNVARANGQQSSAFGQNARATRLRSTALGHGSAATVNDGTAVGKSASVAAGRGTALGQNAQVREGADGSVAIGQNSIANAANTVSVGRNNGRRRIVQVEDGINQYDAVNYGQISSMMATNNLEQLDAIDQALAAVKELQKQLAERDQMLAAMQTEIDELRAIQPQMLAEVAVR